MRPPEEEVIRKIAGDWLYKADLDIRSAEALLSRDQPLLYPSCFHSQQAVEKYLKAYLTWRQVEFPKTHSIREILNLVKTVDEELAVKLQPAAALTPYGVEVRHPGDIPEPTHGEAEQARALARCVQEAILSVLPFK
jgi:HEPN domain-containing protein